ncbi:MAG: efflux RND transporter periplasmic adaptor subunit [Methylophilaceae bacterium]|nr:efflux RND transporter periplasmic adaptor subunit [Methylophilaceae bacterium]
MTISSMNITDIPIRKIAIALTLSVLLTSCSASKAPEAVQKETDEQSDKPLPEAKASSEKGIAENNKDLIQLSAEDIQQSGVKVTDIQSEKIADQLILSANIAANQDRIAFVAPRVEGKLIKVTANLGDQVKAGQSLAVIDSIQMGEARAENRHALSELKLAEANFQRTDKLYKDEVVPQRQWLEVKNAYERAQTSARESADHLHILVGSSDTGISTFVITAPFSGVVIEKDAVMGELAKPEGKLFTIADLSTVWIEADVSEKDLGKLTVGSPATVTVSSFPDESFKGKVSYVSSIFDKETRTVKARIELLNPDRKLRIDMFARAMVDLASSRDALILPQDAVLLVQGQSTVYIQTENGFEARPVELGEQLNKGVVIKSGLKAGEQVVTSGAYALKSRQLKSQIGEE